MNGTAFPKLISQVFPNGLNIIETKEKNVQISKKYLYERALYNGIEIELKIDNKIKLIYSNFINKIFWILIIFLIYLTLITF